MPNLWRSLATTIAGAVAAFAVSTCSAPDYKIGESSCRNGELDWNETDIDCGGPYACDRCKDGDSCKASTDCVSGLCTSNICQITNATAGGATSSGGAHSQGGKSAPGTGGSGATGGTFIGSAGFVGTGGAPDSAGGSANTTGGTAATTSIPTIGGSGPDQGGTNAIGGWSSNVTGLSGGMSGVVSTGGTISVGGALATGGAIASGGAGEIGGAAASGGAGEIGGAAASGGVGETGGVAEAGGAVATGGAAEAGGAVATGGAAETGGAVATGGAAETGGAVATGGVPATGGSSAVANFCSTRTVVPTSGLITDFSEFTSGTTWNSAGTNVDWGGSSILAGRTFFYGTSGVTTTATITTGGRVQLTASLANGNYVGFGLNFGVCGDASAFSGISAVIGGSLNNATLKWQLQTSNNTPIDTTTGRGECAYTSADTKWTECVYNGLTITGVSTTVATFNRTWSQFTGGLPATTVDKNEVIGIQWQLECGSTSGCSSINITIDDVKFY